MRNRGKKLQALRRKVVSGSSVMRVFGSSYMYKEEAKKVKKDNRRRQHNTGKKNRPIKTEHSVRAISTPFGGMNKSY